ncbi:MAG: hypothetical protein JST92_06430, partial [Deltaproteobacteria bacterium]|nr:hypothetical protein [Deltaproteobacteria bacterium]
MPAGQVQTAGVRSSRTRWAAPGLIGLVFAVCVARYAWMIRRHVVDVLFWDQWDFLQPVFDGEPLWASFRWQHGSHRQGLGGVVLALLYPASGFSNRAEAWVALGLFALAALAFLWVIARVGRGLTFEDACVPAMVLTLSAWEAFGGTQNLAYGPFPLAFLGGLALAQLVERRPLRWGLTALLGALATHSAFAVAWTPLVPLLLALELRAPLTAQERAGLGAAVALSTLAIVSVFVGYRHADEQDVVSGALSQPFALLRFAALMLAHPWGIAGTRGALRVPLALVIFAAVCALQLWSLRRLWATRAAEVTARLVWLLAGSSLAYALLAAPGRVGLGLELASSSRYVSHMVPAMIAVWLALRTLRPVPIVRLALVSICLLVCAKEVLKVRAIEVELSKLSDAKRAFVACELASHD